MQIALQGNGDIRPSNFPCTNLGPPTQLYRSLAVQYGSGQGNTYASVHVPVGQTIPNWLLDRALYYSGTRQVNVIFAMTGDMHRTWRL